MAEGFVSAKTMSLKTRIFRRIVDLRCKLTKPKRKTYYDFFGDFGDPIHMSFSHAYGEYNVITKLFVLEFN